jgi:7,8-dihydropterin-6-yl-methyl-4-(beta-D-ribofuranosyl)aminobenzene 5'-phosphate synthase
LGEGVGLHGVIGGFHLADAETPQLNDTARDIAKSNPKILLPGHCTGWRAKYVMEKEMPGKLAPSTVGTKFTFA